MTARSHWRRRDVTGRSAIAPLLLVALIVVVAAGWWVLRPDGRGAREVDLVEVGLVDPGRRKARAPEAPIGDDGVGLVPVDVDDALDATLDADDATGEAGSAAPGATITGVVVDELGAPVAGAEVHGVPSARACEALLGFVPSRSEVLVDRLPAARTDAAGVFAVEVPFAAADRGDVWPAVPEVVVRAPGFASRAVACAGFDGRAFDVGRVALAAESALFGRLLDEDRRALPDVEIRVRPRNPEPAPDGSLYLGTLDSFTRTTTDAGGRFTLDGLPAGEVGLLINEPGFVPIEAYGITLPASVRLDAGDLVLVRGRAISGWVLDAAGAPVSGALVLASERDQRQAFIDFDPGDVILWELEQAVDDDWAARAKSGADGRFTIEGVRAEVVTLYVDAPGFEPFKIARVEADEGDVTCVLQRPAVLVLTILDAASGAPVEGAEVDVVRDTFAEVPAARVVVVVGGAPQTPPADLAALLDRDALRGLENEAGAAVVVGIGARDNQITIRAPGYADAKLVVPGVAAPGVVREEVRLQRGATLSAQFVDFGRAPLEGIDAQLEPLASDPDASPREPRAARSLADGTVRFEAVPPGRWRLAAGTRSANPGLLPHEHEAVELDAGMELDLGKIVLVTAGAIEGTVLDAAGALVGGAAVTIVDAPDAHRPVVQPGARGRDVVVTDAEGRFRFESLVSGVYELASEPGGAASVEVRGGTTSELVIRRVAPPVLIGRATAAGVPVPGVRIFAREVDSRASIYGTAIARRTAYTDARGEFRLEAVTAGPHTVVVDVPSGPRLDFAVTLNWNETTVRDVTLGGASVAGLVVAAEGGRPVADARVTLTETATGRQARARTDEMGRFVVRHLDAGTWALRTRAAPLADAVAGPWRLGPSEALEGVRVEMRAGASIRGRLVPPAGESLPEWTSLALLDAEGLERSRHEDVGAEGTFSFPGLAAGAWTLRVFRLEFGEGDLIDGPVLFETTLVLGDAETRELEIDLE